MTAAVFEDDTAGHQIRLRKEPDGALIVSCSCRKRPGGSYEPLETRERWDAPEVLADAGHLKEVSGP